MLLGEELRVILDTFKTYRMFTSQRPDIYNKIEERDAANRGAALLRAHNDFKERMLSKGLPVFTMPEPGSEGAAYKYPKK